ncbi:uncharacterized protein [Bemisia tabaci]|uniref:uncharacterized protein n=1 Tax=Bemisia tabaci TaxID=7038 RepID=UPI003B2880E2
MASKSPGAFLYCQHNNIAEVCIICDIKIVSCSNQKPHFICVHWKNLLVCTKCVNLPVFSSEEAKKLCNANTKSGTSSSTSTPVNTDISTSGDIFLPCVKITHSNTPKNTSNTDEDGWTTIIPSKRKHHSSTGSPQKDPKKKPINSNVNKNKKKTPVKVNLNNSKFSVLGDSNANSEKIVKPSLPPPIFVSRIKDSAKFRELEVDPIALAAKMKAINRTQLKVVVNSIDEYKNLTNSFKEKKIPFHTFQPRNVKAVRMVIRGLPVDFLTSDIKTSLEKRENIIVRNVSQVRRLKDKSRLALFFVDFEPWENFSDFKKSSDSIKEIKQFLISFEPPKLQRKIIQCKNCWSFGHAKGGCFRPLRCIWCRGFHVAQECPIRTPSIEGIPTCSPPPICAGVNTLQISSAAKSDPKYKNGYSPSEKRGSNSKCRNTR